MSSIQVFLCLCIITVCHPFDEKPNIKHCFCCGLAGLELTRQHQWDGCPGQGQVSPAITDIRGVLKCRKMFSSFKVSGQLACSSMSCASSKSNLSQILCQNRVSLTRRSSRSLHKLFLAISLCNFGLLPPAPLLMNSAHLPTPLFSKDQRSQHYSGSLSVRM